MKNYNINYIENTIEVTKKFVKAAGVLNSPEYNELLAIRHDNPGFQIVIREIKKKVGKKTYKNLTIAKMCEYIVDWEGKDSEAVKRFDKGCRPIQGPGWPLRLREEVVPGQLH